MKLKEAKLGNIVRVYTDGDVVVAIPTNRIILAKVIAIYTSKNVTYPNDYVLGWRDKSLGPAQAYCRIGVGEADDCDYVPNQADFEWGMRVASQCEIVEIVSASQPTAAPAHTIVAQQAKVADKIISVDRNIPKFDFDAYNGLKR
jgi:hypothetical protein